MLPYGLNQEVEFKKDFGPLLGNLNLDKISKVDEIDFTQKILPVYKAISKVSNHKLTNKKSYYWFCWCSMDVIGLYIQPTITQTKFKKDFFKDDFLINRVLLIIEKFLKIHIKNQIDNGADIIQIFDSWAGLLKKKIYQIFYTALLSI